MTSTTEDALVPVHVPRQHLSAVYGFIASLDSADPIVIAGADDSDPAEVIWPAEDLRRFAQTPSATSISIGKVLDVLAAAPGEYLSTTQLEDKTGVPRQNLRGAFSGLTRHVKAHYGARGWMLTYVWGPDLGPSYPAESHYILSEEQAARWIEARTA